MSRLGTAYLRAIQTVGRHLPYGTNVFERPWDVLVVLDGCRADLLAAVADDYAFLTDVGSIRSVGSSSSEWLENTLIGHPETGRTVMVTANTWTDRYLDADAFAALDEVWKYAWDDDHGTIPPDAITDRAIAYARETESDRLVAHYMQPHHPFVPDPLDGDDGLVRAGSHSTTANPWVALRQNEVSVDRVWAAYRANLHYVLNEVESLCENVDGQVAITADHGNLFGEWGLYGHPMETPVPALITVPWATTTATDRKTRTPKIEPPEPLPVSRVYGADTANDRLDALGYRE